MPPAFPARLPPLGPRSAAAQGLPLPLPGFPFLPLSRRDQLVRRARWSRARAGGAAGPRQRRGVGGGPAAPGASPSLAAGGYGWDKDSPPSRGLMGTSPGSCFTLLLFLVGWVVFFCF